MVEFQEPIVWYLVTSLKLRIITGILNINLPYKKQGKTVQKRDWNEVLAKFWYSFICCVKPKRIKNIIKTKSFISNLKWSSLNKGRDLRLLKSPWIPSCDFGWNLLIMFENFKGGNYDERLKLRFWSDFIRLRFKLKSITPLLVVWIQLEKTMKNWRSLTTNYLMKFKLKFFK